MDTIREQLGKPWVTAVLGLVVGIFIGLVVLGWGLFPVQWKDATPALLRTDLKQDYLRMAIESYSKNPDKSLAAQRWTDIGPEAPDLLLALQTAPKGLTPNEIAQFSSVVQAGISAVPNPAATTAPAAETKPLANLPVVLGLMCVLTLVIGGALAYVFLVRNRKVGDGAPAIAAPTAEKSQRTVFTAVSKEPPVAQFMTTYMAGDDLYDDFFSIDSPSGEFLGECGVGISDTIGVGDPKKVAAFEVWLFDKNDIQTVTKVLMSEHAFNDAGIRQRLESKGEPIMTEPGKRILLETATLQLEARVVDMNYGQGALPPCSFLDRLTLELAVWPKPQAE